MFWVSKKRTGACHIAVLTLYLHREPEEEYAEEQKLLLSKIISSHVHDLVICEVGCALSSDDAEVL